MTQRAILHLSYLLSRLRTLVNSRYWDAARGGSKLIRSHKRAREWSPKLCLGNCASFFHVLVVLSLFGSITDPVSDFLSSCRTNGARPRYSLELPIPTDVKYVPL